MKYNTGTKKIHSKGRTPISQRLVKSRKIATTWCDGLLRYDRNLMKEVKLTSSFFNNSCLSLSHLLTHSLSLSLSLSLIVEFAYCLITEILLDVSPETCQSIHDGKFNVPFLQNNLGLHAPQVKDFLYNLRHNVFLYKNTH